MVMNINRSRLRLGRTSQETACSIIETLISSSHTPTAVIAQLAELLIPAATTSNAPAAEIATARRILSAIQQRHPAILQNSGKRLIENEEGLKDQIEQLMISLSIVRFICAACRLLTSPCRQPTDACISCLFVSLSNRCKLQGLGTRPRINKCRCTCPSAILKGSYSVTQYG